MFSCLDDSAIRRRTADQASRHGELLDDARALGVGSIDDLAAGFVTLNAKGDGGAIMGLARHLLSPEPPSALSPAFAAKACASFAAASSDIFVDGVS